METLFIFLLKASAGIVLFYLVYWFSLRKETFYNANRWFLIIALVSAFLLPIIPVQYSVLIEQKSNTTVLQVISDTFKNIPIISESNTQTSEFNWQQAVLIFYLTGAAIFIFRLLSQSFLLISLMIKYRIKSLDGIRIIENEKYSLPFSFFNVVFINPKIHKQADLPEILAHEKVHIRENHWFDLLLIELLTVIFWFNPFIWFFERAIKQNHEYLADKGVILQGHSVGRYQAILLNQLMGMQIIGITNNLNFALNTNRLKMMTKKKTSAIRRLKFVWALPAIALLLFAFAEPSYRVKVTESENLVSAINSGEKEFTISGKVVRIENGKPLPGASIVIKGTTVGTVSDINGEFILIDSNPKVDSKTGALSSRIVVSYVGLKTVENVIAASGKAIDNTKFTFIMENAVILIDTDIPPPPPPPMPITRERSDVPPPPPAKGEEEVFFIVEDMPQYPGGHWELMSYVNKMQKKISIQKEVKGKAKVGFTVNAKGKVIDIKIVEKDNDGAAKGAYIIAEGMEDWKPGKQRGKPVSVKYLLPVKFK